MRLRNPRLLLLVLAIAVIGAACGGGDDVTPTTVPAPTQAPTPVSAAPTAAPGSVISTPSPGPTAAPVPTPTTASAPQPASLEVRVTDAPPDGVTAIVLTVENIQVNVAENVVGSGWETVVEGPISFDLVAVTGIEEILGSAELPPGRYNQIRLRVTEAMVTVDGEDKPATLPSGVLRIVGGFDVNDGETTVLTLDFDAARSLVLRGRQDPILKPVVKLLVRRSDQPMSAAQTASEVIGSGGELAPGESVVTIGPSKDNSLYETEDGSKSNGAGLGLFVGKTNLGSIRRGLVAFDLADTIPDGATITDVTLRLHVSKTSSDAQSIGLHKLLADWGEGTSDASANEGNGTSAEEGDATWLHRFFDGDTWTTPGGDFDATASATAVVGGRADYVWGDSDALIADVQAWLDDPSSNFGWVVIGNEEDNKSTKRFDTKESEDGVDGPALTITYAMPPAATPVPVPTATSAPAPTATPTPAPVPTATPAPAAGNTDGAGVQDDVEVVRVINVTLVEFSIIPSVISIQAGEKVQFNVTNAGSVFHTFTFELGGQQVSVDLLAGETGTTDVLTFGQAPQVRFFCQPHEFVPMVGVINVSGGETSAASGNTTTNSAEENDGY